MLKALSKALFKPIFQAACVTIMAIFWSAPARAADPKLAKFEPSGNRVYHGAAVPQFWDSTGFHTEKASFETVAGKKTALITWFASVYLNGRITNWRQNYTPILKRVQAENAVSLIKFSTPDSTFNQTKKAATPQQIASGVWDAYFVAMARDIRDFGAPVFISIDHEMNGSWYPYSQATPDSGTTAADFVAMWQRIVTVFRREKAHNAAFVWSPNVPNVGPIPFSAYYPGDKFVDWVGVSFYSGNPIEALNPIYQTYASKKPIFITEWATEPQKSTYNPKYPGDANWMTDFFDALEGRYPRVKAISWFNWDAGEGNYRLARQTEQVDVYARRIQHERYIERDEDLLKMVTAPKNAKPLIEYRPNSANPRASSRPMPERLP